MYNEPGRMVSTGGVKAPGFFVFASGRPDLGRGGLERRRAALVEAYAGGGWEVPRLLEGVREAEAVHLDTLSRVEMGGYTRGRVVLLGDAAHGSTLAGFGSGLAVVGAHVLAGESAAADGDHRGALAAYDRRMLEYAKVTRKGNAGRFPAPRTRRGIRARDALFRVGFLYRALEGVTEDYATGVDLGEYPEPAPGRPS
jgi:2-polyprenyl-6-methoxyphenol hydroxylase-like FAD-dependent oxidoreductase